MTEIYFVPEAEAEANRIDLEWRAHARTNPRLFAEELLRAQQKAARMREVYEIYRWAQGEAIRRVNMPRAKHHLYYYYDATSDRVVIVSVWGSSRETGPPLEKRSF